LSPDSSHDFNWPGDFQALLVRCLAAAGDGIRAARQAAACRELFGRELGVQPGATRSLLHRAALGDKASGAAARLLASEIDNPALRTLVDS
jgi:hypothetical protein